MRFPTAIPATVRSSIKLKLVLVVVAILAVTVGIAPWSAIRVQEQQLLRDSEEHLRSLQELLRVLVADAMLIGDRDQIQRLIQEAGSHKDVKLLRIFDTDGIVHFSSNPEERGTRLSPAEMHRYVGMKDPVMLSREGGNIAHTVLQPMLNRPACFRCHPPERKVLGILQLSLSLDQVGQQVASLERSALVATLITLGVIIIGVWLALTLLIDQPLQRLVDVMVRVEHGDLSVRATVPNRDELGQLAGHFNDMISRLHAAHEELEQYHQEQMARADRLATLGQMAAAIAHEIRNPLTGISGALSVLSRDFLGDDPRREIVRQTRLLIDRLNKTVEDILHYSRPSLPQFQTVKLDDIIDRSVSLVGGEAKKVGVQIVRASSSVTGVNGESRAIDADPQQIQQVLVNLILNAIQASAAGGQIWIRTHSSEDHDEPPRLCVEIEDNGKGMTQKEAAQAFQPFFSTKAHGTGLGLPIARQIIEQHHGRISLRGTAGRGSFVLVELPEHIEPSQESGGSVLENEPAR
ncbi:MAG: ATP-binding protein [Candidatus Binatia bacterium]